MNFLKEFWSKVIKGVFTERIEDSKEGKVMIFKFMVRDKGNPNGTVREETTHATDEKELIDLYDKMGFEIVKVLSSERDPMDEGPQMSTDEAMVQLRSNVASRGPGQPNQGIPPNIPMPSTATPQIPRYNYFEDDGVIFRMDNVENRLYKRDWSRIEDQEANQYMIESPKGKSLTPLSKSNIKLLKLDWVPIQGKDMGGE